MPTIQETIEKAISIKGSEILRNKLLLCNVLEDLSPDLYSTISFINKVHTDAVGEMLFKAYSSANLNEKKGFINEADRILFEEEDRGEKTRGMFLDYFGVVLLTEARGNEPIGNSAYSMVQDHDQLDRLAFDLGLNKTAKSKSQPANLRSGGSQSQRKNCASQRPGEQDNTRKGVGTRQDKDINLKDKDSSVDSDAKDKCISQIFEYLSAHPYCTLVELKEYICTNSNITFSDSELKEFILGSRVFEYTTTQTNRTRSDLTAYISKHNSFDLTFSESEIIDYISNHTNYTFSQSGTMLSRALQNNSDGSVTEGYKEDGGVWNGEFKKTFKNGAYYKGTYVKGRIEGELTYVDSEGFSTVGIWKNNNWNGECRKENNDDSITVGFRKDGVWDGPFTKTYTNGAYYKGTHLNGNVEGKLTYVDRQGNEFNCEWHNGNWNGNGIYHSKRGFLTGYWKNGEVVGNGVYGYVDKSVYVGEIKNFLRDGKGIIKIPPYDIELSAVFKDDKIINPVTISFPGGDTYVGAWSDIMEGNGTFTSSQCPGIQKITYSGGWKEGMLSGRDGKLTVVQDQESTFLYDGGFLCGNADGYGYLYICESDGIKDPLIDGIWINNKIASKSKNKMVKTGEDLIRKAVDYIKCVTEKVSYAARVQIDPS